MQAGLLPIPGKPIGAKGLYSYPIRSPGERDFGAVLSIRFDGMAEQNKKKKYALTG